MTYLWGPLQVLTEERSRKMLMCRHCIEELRSRGEEFIVTEDAVITLDEAEELSGTEEVNGAELLCEWCGEADDLYGVIFR